MNVNKCNPNLRLFDNLKVIHQTHTDNIKCLTEEDIDLESVDGVMTDHPGIPVYTKSADCLLALMYDPKKKVLAALMAMTMLALAL